MHETQLDKLDYLISKAKKLGADEVDAVILGGQSLSATYKEGKVENTEYSEGDDVGLRVIIGKKQAMVSSSIINKSSLDDMAQRAVDMAKHVPEDPYCGLAPKELLATDFVELDNFDENQPSMEKLIEDAKQIEQAALEVKGVSKSDGADIGFSTTEVSLAASNGFSRSYKRSGCSSQIIVMAGSQENDNMERDYEFSGAVYYYDLLDFQTLGKKAAQRAIRKLNPQKIKTQKMPIIFEPRMARSLLSHFSSAINGVAIARGTSFLKDCMGKGVFSKNITITEDPFRKRGLRSRPVDTEGIKPSKRNIIENGKLNSWILDLHTSRKLGLTSTGNAVRGTSSAPSPSISNLYINSGETALSDMIKNINYGFFVTELIGQGVKIITGDYSRGASGFLIENGEITTPVSEVTIAGNLKDMFLNMTAAKELEFLYGIDSPALLVDEMTVAGS